MKPVNVVFMGTPIFAVPVLEAVAQICVEEEWVFSGVYSSPDKPKGRGRSLSASPVRERANELGLDVFTPPRLSTPEAIDQFRELNPSLIVLAAYGLLLPKEFLFEPKYGAINIHPSLLPRYRGAAPVAAAILEGVTVTGTSIILMDEGLDTGPLLSQKEYGLQGTEKAEALTFSLFSLGAEMLREILPKLVHEEVKPVPQGEVGASFWGRWVKEDGIIDWLEPGETIERKIRALDHWPGSWTYWNHIKMEIIEAHLSKDKLEVKPGEVIEVSGQILIGTGTQPLVIDKVKLAGKSTMPMKAFLLGHANIIGTTVPS
tara:strand:- start:11295 stop:12245 length:951 start_codon:yes stop_codon:yes gene_type:complete